MVHWLQFYKLGSRSNARSLLPQGLYVKLYCPSSNPETWTTGEWFYNNVIYDNLASLRRAWRSPRLYQAVQETPRALWTDTEDFESNPAGRSKPPPLSIQPHGGRYDLDRQATVSCHGWALPSMCPLLSPLPSPCSTFAITTQD